jgi:hypothetical protein
MFLQYTSGCFLSSILGSIGEPISARTNRIGKEVSGMGAVDFRQFLRRADVFRRREVDRAFVTTLTVVASHIRQVPTGRASIMPGWTGRASVRRVLLDLPARYQCQQSTQSFLIQPFFMDEVTDTTHPQQVVVGEKPAVVSPCGLEQAAFLIQAKSAWVNAQEFGGDANRVERGSAIGHLFASLRLTRLRATVAFLDYIMFILYCQIY